jgi:hypothetical protein
VIDVPMFDAMVHYLSLVVGSTEPLESSTAVRARRTTWPPQTGHDRTSIPVKNSKTSCQFVLEGRHHGNVSSARSLGGMVGRAVRALIHAARQGATRQLDRLGARGCAVCPWVVLPAMAGLLVEPRSVCRRNWVSDHSLDHWISVFPESFGAPKR